MTAISDTTMKKFPEAEKPYEICEAYGPGALSDAQLLSVIMRTGAAGLCALDMSRSILKMLDKDGIAGLYHISCEELRQIKGIGKVKALQLLCVAELSRRIVKSSCGLHSERSFDSPGAVAEYFMEDLRHEDQEFVLVLCLDIKNRLISQTYVSKGTADQALISPREVFRYALSRRAFRIILVHNHPSGDPTPSSADICLTERIRDAGNLVGIPLADHIIVGDLCMVSFAASGDLKKYVA